MKRETIYIYLNHFQSCVIDMLLSISLKEKSKVSLMLTVQTVKKQITLTILKIYKQITLQRYTTEFMIEIVLHC
jgi:hypothetical protein